MSRISKEISCITGEYTNAAGERKKRYQRIGSQQKAKRWWQRVWPWIGLHAARRASGT